MKDERADHVVLYMKRKFLLRWKRIVLIPDKPAFLYGSSDDTVFARRVGSGTTLWIVSPGPDKRRPVLVATMEVDRLAEIKCGKAHPDLGVRPEILNRFVQEGYRWIASGPEKAGAYYGYNEAGEALRKTTFGLGKPWTLSQRGDVWINGFYRCFQGPRAVAAKSLVAGVGSGIKPLQSLAGTAQHSVFISYKWGDGVKRKVRAFTLALAKNGFMPWLDTFAFPRAGYSREFKRDPDRLEKLLRYGYKRCKAVIAIGTPHYGEMTPKKGNKNWTEREWSGELWVHKRPHRILYPHRDFRRSALLERHPEKKMLKKEDPWEAALELKRWFKKNGIW
jgi:hypothetical protein